MIKDIIVLIKLIKRGTDAYLGSRDIIVNGVNTQASHNFIVVTNNSGTQTFSYGRQASGQLGLINGRGASVAGDTAAIDAAAFANNTAVLQRINAPDYNRVQYEVPRVNQGSQGRGNFCQ